jgi:hypothetical protein
VVFKTDVSVHCVCSIFIGLPHALTGYVWRMQKAAESVTALSQNVFGGCLEDWTACTVRCVASHGSCCEVENT